VPIAVNVDSLAICPFYFLRLRCSKRPLSSLDAVRESLLYFTIHGE
jgi:hypothetical protein